MISALLCPGPSLARLKERPVADVVIGVNRAAALWPCDWWCFGDVETWRSVTPIGTPRMCTEDNAERRMRREGYAGELSMWRDHRGPDCTWRTFSATAALVLAVGLGATRIDCYGVDMTGTAYVDGAPLENQNVPNRWDCERRLWDKVTRWCAENGCEVVRHGTT